MVILVLAFSVLCSPIEWLLLGVLLRTSPGSGNRRTLLLVEACACFYFSVTLRYNRYCRRVYKLDVLLPFSWYRACLWTSRCAPALLAPPYEVYPAVKEDSVTNQRVTIHYNCIGAFEVPDRRKIPERDILLETRKGVALSYAPAV